MPKKRAKALLDHLGPGECAQVLSELLESHQDLREEANEIAERLIDDVSVEEIAEEVGYLVGSIDLEELDGRSGRHSWGYVEPTQAAWDLLEESIEDIRTDMKRRFEAGMKSAAEKVCQGIVLGLYEVDGTSNDGVLGWAPDFPGEAAAWSLSILLELYPQRERRAAGKRIVRAIKERVGGWAEMLDRVVTEATAKTQRGRK